MTMHPDRDITRGEAVDLAEQAMNDLDVALDKAWQVASQLLSAIHNKRNYTDRLDSLIEMTRRIAEAVSDFEEGRSHAPGDPELGQGEADVESTPETACIGSEHTEA